MSKSVFRGLPGGGVGGCFCDAIFCASGFFGAEKRQDNFSIFFFLKKLFCAAEFAGSVLKKTSSNVILRFSIYCVTLDKMRGLLWF